ncbi:MAG: hypothetical protein JWO26_971, partial [Rhodospirillales bacterium]|nr:hypothetical protein [Rhodospirillales bacterium]
KGERSYVNARIASLALAIATHHLKMAGPDLAQLEKIAKQLRMSKRGMTERNKKRLRAMDDAGRTEALIHLPLLMAAEVDKAVKQTGKSTPSLARKYETALAFELVLFNSWRISNLGGLTIGETLLLRPDGRAVVAFHGSAVKNNQSVETVLSPRAFEMLNTYSHCSPPAAGRLPLQFPVPRKGDRPRQDPRGLERKHQDGTQGARGYRCHDALLSPLRRQGDLGQ